MKSFCDYDGMHSVLPRLSYRRSSLWTDSRRNLRQPWYEKMLMKTNCGMLDTYRKVAYPGCLNEGYAIMVRERHSSNSTADTVTRMSDTKVCT